MSNLADKIEYNNIDQTLKIKVDGKTKHDSVIELKQMQILQMDWTLLKSELVKQVDKKFNIDENQKEKIMFDDLKKLVKKLKIKTKEEYITLSKKNIVSKNPDKQFITLWKGWYDLLGIDIDKFPSTKEKWLKICRDKNIQNYDDYKQIYHKHNLPELPKELYELNDIDSVFKLKPSKSKRRKNI